MTAPDSEEMISYTSLVLNHCHYQSNRNLYMANTWIQMTYKTYSMIKENQQCRHHNKCHLMRSVHFLLSAKTTAGEKELSTEHILEEVWGRRQRDGREKQQVGFLSHNQQTVEWNVNDSTEYNGPWFSFRVITHVRLLFKNPALLIKAFHCSTSGTGQ